MRWAGVGDDHLVGLDFRGVGSVGCGDGDLNGLALVEVVDAAQGGLRTVLNDRPVDREGVGERHAVAVSVGGFGCGGHGVVGAGVHGAQHHLGLRRGVDAVDVVVAGTGSVLFVELVHPGLGASSCQQQHQ